MYGAQVLLGRRFAVAACAGAVAIGFTLSGCSTTTYTVLPSPVASSAPTSTVAAPPGVLLNGVYQTLVGEITAQWTISSPCATDGCTARISSSNGGWTGDAKLTKGRWTLTVVRPDGVTCRNGSTQPSTNTYAWDATSLEGTVDSSHDAVCPGEPAGTFNDTFTIVTPPVSSVS